MEYPSYSIYYLTGGQLCNPFSRSKRKEFKTVEEARRAMVHEYVRRRSSCDDERGNREY